MSGDRAATRRDRACAKSCGPRFPGNLFFGDSIDEIGELSPIPTIAARIIDSDWNRVLYFQGLAKNWTVREEDAAMALDVAQRVAAQKGIELVIFATDAEEIQISRRVYRSGEGEYLINQQVCRLKDVKDLLLGSGAGSGASTGKGRPGRAM